MNIKSISVIVFSIICLSSCIKEDLKKEPSKYVLEPHSYAQPNKAVITHLDLNIQVDFEN